MNLKIFTTVPPGPVTLASLTNPAFVRRGIDLRVAANRVFSLCYLSIQSATSALGAPAYVPPAGFAVTTAAGAAAGSPGGTSSAALGPDACPPPSDPVCCLRTLQPQSTAVFVNFTFDAALSSVDILWSDPAARPSASTLAASAAWAAGAVSIIGKDSESGCSMLDGPAPNNITGFVSRQLVCGGRAVGRRVALQLPSIARGLSAGRMVRVCVSRSTDAMGMVTLSVQASP